MAAETRKSRKSNFSQEEIDVLITTVMQNHNILYGETSKSFFHKEIRNQVWNIILEEVNKVSLERRTLNEVKNKWKKCQYNLRAADHVETVGYVECDDLDSMPLQQRLSQNHNEQPPSTPTQEPVLQSQPISPTKLKVTRQGAKPQQPPAKPPTPPPPNPEVCLRWNSHHTNMQAAFPSLLTKEQYVDATLVSEGKTLKCHRMILSSCSPYFEAVLEGISPFQHPVLFMKDTPFWILKALCDFMYAGEVHIFQDKLQELLNVAEALKIKGLAGSLDPREDIKPIMPEIKQEIDVAPPRVPDRPLKEELEDEPPPPPKATKHEMVKPSKKRDEKKSKHSGQAVKEKEKEKIVEDPPPKVIPKANPKVVLPKVAPKVVPKVVLPKVILPKIQPTPKTTVKNVMKNVLQKVPKPSTSKATHASRKSDTSRKNDKHKADGTVQKEKEKEKDKPALKKDNINDPLDLLQPVYEEIAKEDPLPMAKSINPAKLKERGNLPVRKGVNKKVKKRRYAEYAEEREESPPPVFSSRKGTRSRPHVKIPKFFHTHYEETQKETTDATIVREPHTDQSDPLIGVEEVEEIKAEPLDVEENTIEMEENMEHYMQDQEMTSQEEEEIIGNYDSPIVNIKREVIKRNTPNIFKKMLEPQPVIMNIHTVTEESQPGVRLLNIHENTLKIVDIAKISTGQNRLEETIIGTNSFDTMDSTHEKTSEIRISNVQSMAEVSEDNRVKEGALLPGETEERVQDDGAERAGAGAIESLPTTIPYPVHPEAPIPRISEENLLPNPSESEEMQTDQIALRIKIENVQSENSQDATEIQRQIESDAILLERPAVTSLGIQEQDAISSGILGGSEARHSLGIQEQDAISSDTLGSSEARHSLGIQEQDARSSDTLERSEARHSLGIQEQDARSSDTLESSEARHSLGIQEQDARSTTTLGSLETRLGAIDIENQVLESGRDAQSEVYRADLIEGMSDSIPPHQDDIGLNLPPEKADQEEGGHSAEPIEQADVESQSLMSVDSGKGGSQSQGMMSVDSERGDDVQQGIVKAGYGEDESDGFNPEKMQKTVENSDVVTEREGIFAVGGTSTEEPYDYVDGFQRTADEKVGVPPTHSEEEYVKNYGTDVRQQFDGENEDVVGVGDEVDGIPEPPMEPAEPATQIIVGSEKFMSVGTLSQEMMSIGSESQEMKVLPLQGSTEETPPGCGEALISINQDIRNNTREIQTVQNVEETYLDLQESEAPNQEVLQKSDSQNLQIDIDDQDINTKMNKFEEGLNKATEFGDNMHNTPEMMSLESQSQSREQNLSEATLPVQISGVQEEVRNSETEAVDILSVDNGCEEQSETSVLQLPRDNNIAAEETEAESAERIEDTRQEVPENIGAELEQCLASTSNIAPIKSSRDKLKITTEKLSFEDDEDFTKDIQFENYVAKSGARNYLADDFDDDDDFVMAETEGCKSQNGGVESESDKVLSEEKEVYSDKIESESGCAKSDVEEIRGDIEQVNEDRLAETDNGEATSDIVDSNLVGSREQNISMDVHDDDPDLEKVSHNTNLNKNTDKHSDTDQTIPEIAENFKEHPGSTEEEEQRLEDSLLADFDDDDVEMKEEASTSEKADDGAEKTLEMIVNDLNESLGELRK